MKPLPRDLWEIVDLKCTVQQLQELLRQAKFGVSEKILIGTLKPDVIQNLKDATAQRLIPLEDVHALVQDSEENGDQHILFYRARNASVAKEGAAGEVVAKKLFGDDWRKRKGFPSFDFKENQFIWSDFRTPLHDARGWIGKIYGHETRLRLRDEKDEKTSLTRIYDKVENRLVCVARWNGHHALEIRVPRAPSRTKIEAYEAQVWSMLAPALRRSDFVELSFNGALKAMLIEALGENDDFFVSDARLVDSESGTAQISTHTEDEDVADADERKTTIENYLRSGHCREIALMFDPDRAGGIWGEKSFRIVAGGQNEHEILVQSTTNGRTIDYVTNQFFKFNR